MICPSGLPRLTSIPFLTMKGDLTEEFESISGTSICQPVRSLPLKSCCDSFFSEAQERMKMQILERRSLFMVLLFIFNFLKQGAEGEINCGSIRLSHFLN